MDLHQKVIRALEAVIRVEKTVQSDDGFIDILVSPDFRGQDSYARQSLIFRALRAPEAGLSPEDFNKVIGFIAFTPEEFEIQGPELLKLT